MRWPLITVRKLTPKINRGSAEASLRPALRAIIAPRQCLEPVFDAPMRYPRDGAGLPKIGSSPAIADWASQHHKVRNE
jgi:hypothetical protein